MSTARGFSLVETVVAIGLLVGALVTLAQIIAGGVLTTARARFRTVATVVAQTQMEQLRGEATLEDTAAGVVHLDGSGAAVCRAPIPCDAAVFSVRWSVGAVGVAPAMLLIRIAVTHAHRNYGEVRAFGIRPRRVR